MGEMDDFDFFLKLAKPLVLNLPDARGKKMFFRTKEPLMTTLFFND